MRKSFLTIATVAALAVSLASPATAARNYNAPNWGQADALSTLSGEPAVPFGTSDVSGAITLNVYQSGVTSQSIVMVDFNLPLGMTWDTSDLENYNQWSMEGYSGSVCDTTNATVDFSGRTATFKGFNCYSSTTTVYFTVTIEDAAIINTLTAEGTYPVTSQYRTNATRKVKAQSWIVYTEAGVELATEEVPG